MTKDHGEKDVLIAYKSGRGIMHASTQIREKLIS